MMMAEKEGLRERGGEGEKGGDSSVWPREGWGIPACLRASRRQRADAASLTDFRHHSVGCPSCDKEQLSTRGRCSCCSRPLFVLLAAEGSVTRGRESMTCKALREKALGRWQKTKKNSARF